MKKAAWCLVMILLLGTLKINAQNDFTLHGKLSGLKNGMKVLLLYEIGNKRVLDSVATKNGEFNFKGSLTVSQPVKASLQLKSLYQDTHVSYLERLLKRDEQDLFLEKGAINLQGDSLINTAIIHGGKTQEEFLELQRLKKAETDQMRTLQQEMIPVLIETQGLGIDTNQIVQSISLKMQPLVAAIRDKEEHFIRAYPDSYVSLDLMEQRSNLMRPGVFEPLLNRLSPRMKNSRLGKELTNKLLLVKRTAPGVKMINFTLPGIDGKIVSLDKYKGKYILIDFWASWCMPCLQENPNLQRVHQQFKNKNFELISVSLDTDKKNWLTAVEAYRMVWLQLSDLRGWNNKAAQEYAINEIPQNFLINPQGIIIAKNLFSQDLIKKLEELLP
ncbi:TlpA disulfide reductase family protein [Pedobacter nutrimenti]|uniref:Peroxiredoxin n=1 Tax=Pedobacter nutrimenti TaxID=1241337 RepID=A0A318UBV3_9SPHI|nr:TlpA disulfide reductase family protein [Pedobacter nutrimenti]PYF73854.1 peroxiredoxin [Pedobacter nutrimenti]